MNASDVEERNVSRVAAGMSGMESMPHMIMDFYLCLFNRRLAAGDYYGHGRWYHLQHRAGRHCTLVRCIAIIYLWCQYFGGYIQ